MPKPMDRKLTVILAADVVGYSAMMERDEAGTHERLRAGRRDLFEPTITRHHGTIFKLMGDGMLAEFSSVVGAVECAVALQRGLAERNAAVPDDQRVQVRIGVNLGEVIVEGEDRFGEGVNIAARLEQLAEPGGIWVSAKVAREVEKKLAFGFETMGPQRVKNISEPVRAYRVAFDGIAGRRRPVRGSLRRPAVAAVVALLAIAIVVWAWWQGNATTGPKLAADKGGPKTTQQPKLPEPRQTSVGGPSFTKSLADYRRKLEKRPSDADVVEFVRAVLYSQSKDDSLAIGDIVRSYTATINYYGKTATLSEVVADKRAYYKRWPERHYAIESPAFPCRVNQILAKSEACSIGLSAAIQEIARRREPLLFGTWSTQVAACELSWRIA
jgi:class 3 adenylate cyclase